jgi:methyl-accepting chemotaxis protein
MVTEVADREAARAKELPGAIIGAKDGLNMLWQLQIEARECSARLGAQYREIAAAFRSLIVAAQFHDLTRQKIEHVITVMKRLLAGPEAHENQIFFGAVVALQSAQLAYTENEFAVSVAKIAESLETIATRVVTMAGQSRTLAGLTDGELPSLLEQLEGGCGALLTCLAECTDAEALTQRTSQELAEDIRRTRQSVADIEAVEMQMRLLALNASIQAAQRGDDGNTLDALAIQMQQRTNEARSLSEALVQVLSSMSDTVDKLAGSDSSSAGPALEPTDNGPDRLGEAVASLHAASERTAEQITQVVAEGNDLSEDVCAARDGFSVGDMVAETLQRTRRLMEPMARTDFDRPSADVAGLVERTAAFTTHYTMQSEHDVYEKFVEAVFGVKPSPQIPPTEEGTPPSSTVEPEEIDVEFF